MAGQANLVTRAAKRRHEADPAPRRVDDAGTRLNTRPAVVAQRAVADTLSAARANRTGLPDGLKAGIETLSGLSMNDVRVHRNSPEPAQLRAHAFAQGTDIHLAPGQDRHLPHEAWHVVQQKQGRVRATMQFKGGVPVNDDAGLEAEADRMGARALTVTTQAADRPVQRVATRAGVAQLLKVKDSDINDDFVVYYGGRNRIGTYLGDRGGGWYEFRIGGEIVNVRGRDNILRRVPAMDGMSDEESSSDSSDEDDRDGMVMDTSSEEEEEAEEAPGFMGEYNSDHIPSDDTEIDIVAVARANNISVQDALMHIRNGFMVVPRTLRLHWPFGSKTVSRGRPAFTLPNEKDKGAQAMVSYRVKDYGHKKKVGKDYDHWADELSDDEEDEEVKQERAQDIVTFLEGNSEMTFDDLTSRQRAALGGLLSVGMISDPLRTEFNSRRTELSLIEQLRARARGETTFHAIFGSKKDSTFLPARKGGSGQQRQAFRKKDEEELLGEDLLWENNCLINAICGAAGRGNATMEELLAIRYNLDNVGDMMIADEDTINVIRHVLGINNEIIVRYPLDGDGANEAFAGVGAALDIFHTGGDHFQHDCPDDENYDFDHPDD